MSKASEAARAIFRHMGICRQFGRPVTIEIATQVIEVAMLPHTTRHVYEAVSSEWRSTKQITDVLIGQKTKSVTVMLSDLEIRGLIESRRVSAKRKQWKRL